MNVWGGSTVSFALLGCLCALIPGRGTEAAPPGAAVFDFAGPVNKQGVPAPWELKVKSGEAQVAIVEDMQTKALHLSCRDASFAVERETNAEVQRAPVLTWLWKAVRLPPRGDVRASKTSDQALQLLLAFDGKKVLSYVWGTQAPVGTVVDQSMGWPVSVTLKVLVVQSGEADVGRWVTMTRNVVDDYRRLFQEEPGPLKGIRVQSNCQHTDAEAEGYMGPIHLSAGSSTP